MHATDKSRGGSSSAECTRVSESASFGQLMLPTLAERNFPAGNVRLFASPRSAGKSLLWRGLGIC